DLWRPAVHVRRAEPTGESTGPLSAIVGRGTRDASGDLHGAFTADDRESAGNPESGRRIPAAGRRLSAIAFATDAGRRAAVGGVDGRSAVGEVRGVAGAGVVSRTRVGAGSRLQHRQSRAEN